MSSYRVIEFFCVTKAEEDIKKLLEHEDVIYGEQIAQGDDALFCRLILPADRTQESSDKIDALLKRYCEKGVRATMSSVEALIPAVKTEEQEKDEKERKEKKKAEGKKKEHSFLGLSREELAEDVSAGVRFDKYFFLLAVFSTVVAAIGLLEDNTAVVIGAMVIAPLLGPNLALAFATTVGDIALVKRSLKVNISGLLLCTAIAAALGYVWPYDLESEELLSRTKADYAGVLLAAASGASAVISLRRGVSGALVGVMVAVALLPPAVTAGVFLGAGKIDLSLGAFLLLAINVICVNFSAKLVFMLSGVKARTWYEQEKAGRAGKAALLFWALSLCAALIVIYLKRN